MRVFWDSAQLAHQPSFFLQRGVVRQNFEVPERAVALLEGVAALGLTAELPRAADRDVLLAVHDARYLDFLRDGPAEWAALAEPGPEMVPNIHPSPEMMANGAQVGSTVIGRLGWYTADTSCPIAAGTWAAAAAAAACAVAAADAAARGLHAYALCRPPGHHAYGARAGGHCYLNNAAIAAERLLALGAQRVAVLDIDSHHGNGTQGVFWNRADVLFVSVHGDPTGYYPWYVGHAAERGTGAGAGFNLNLPLTQGTGDSGWLAALQDGLAAIRAARVDALVLSLGFDASEHEPLRYLQVSEEGFAAAAAAIVGLRVPTAIVQEGGYNTAILGRLLERTLQAFI